MSRIPWRRVPVNGTDRFARRLARRWVLLYTAPLPRDERDARRAEIDSDLWEHLADAQADQQSLVIAQPAVLARMLFGVPSDLIWVGRVRRTMKEHRSMKQRRLRIIALLCATVVIVTFFATNLLLRPDNVEQHADIWWILAVPIGFFLVGTIGIVATALLIRDRRNSRVAGATND